VGCFSLASMMVNAQADTVHTQPEENQKTDSVRRLDPRRALLYSAVLPGMGQIYNGKYWKLPFVYGGFVGFILVVDYFQKGYVKYRDDLFTLLSTGTSPLGIPESRLRVTVDRARRQRDYFLIFTGIWYFLQVVDAHVDAHLQEFKWNKDMRISLQPSIEQNVLTGKTTGLTLTFKF
jgi:Family of unknown function (DUF5683)